jgi:hypothetical protein
MKMRTFLLLLLAACAQNTVRREKLIVAPVVVANNVCTSGAVNAEVNGKQMTCRRRTEVGTYLAHCVCWDAAYSEEDGLQAQRTMRLGMPIDACGSSASCELQGQVGGLH